VVLPSQAHRRQAPRARRDYPQIMGKRRLEPAHLTPSARVRRDGTVTYPARASERLLAQIVVRRQGSTDREDGHRMRPDPGCGFGRSSGLHCERWSENRGRYDSWRTRVLVRNTCGPLKWRSVRAPVPSRWLTPQAYAPAQAGNAGRPAAPASGCSAPLFPIQQPQLRSNPDIRYGRIRNGVHINHSP